MEKKAKEIIENNVVEFSITLSLIEQLNDNHEAVVRLAQKAEKKEISDFKKEVSKKGIELITLGLETPAIYDPTVKMLFISKRMIDENECMDSDFVEQIKERFGIAR